MISVRPIVSRPHLLYHNSRLVIRRRVSPIATDIMATFDARGSGLSAMLIVFFLGRIVIDAAESSNRNEEKYDSSDSDDD